MGEVEMQSFNIISNVGTARSLYIEAIAKAKSGDFEGAYESIKEGEKNFLLGHEAHMKLIEMEAQGKSVGGSLILIHAEDQLMSAEGFKIIANEFIDAYKKMASMEVK